MTFSKYKDPTIVDTSMNSYIRTLVMYGKEHEKDLKEIKHTLKMSEKPYFMMIIRGWA